MRHKIRLPVALAIVTLGATVFPFEADAHVEPDPATLPTATAVTVSFLIEHGCDHSATAAVSLQFPEEIADARPVDKVGWTTSVDGNLVTFAGGPLPATAEDGFTVTFTTPSSPGLWPVPVIQTCVVGEMAWVEIVEPGQPEPEYPAPLIAVGEVSPSPEPTAVAAPPKATVNPHRSGRDLLIGACFGSVLTASAAVAVGRRHRAPG